MLARKLFTAVAAAAILVGAAASARAAETYKIGISAGLTGYLATIDHAWSDAVNIAADALNANGGIMGRKVEVFIEDNKSQPEDAVTAYRKMIYSDHVDIFASGCVSAGNFAAAPTLVKEQIPMVVCSILPTKPDQVKWAFTTIPPPRFEVETRLQYLQKKTPIRKVGVIHDPSPYANAQSAAAVKEAAQYGIQVVDVETYGQNDSDLSTQISKIHAAGGEAILKMGVGGSTLTAAKDIKQLGLNMPLLTSLEDKAVFQPVADVLGDNFLFVAAPAQIFDALPDGPLKAAIAVFLKPWRAKYQDRDPNWGGRGWDAVMLIKTAVEQSKSFKGPKVRDAIEGLSNWQGTTGVYHFSPENHQGLTENPLYLARIKNGKVVLAE